MTPARGSHNGAPGASPTKMFYFMAEIVSFRDGIRGLKPDQRGVYLSLLLEIYDAMGPIKFDVRLLAMATGMDQRLLNRVIGELESLGKIYIADGWIHNSRAEKEISDYLNSYRVRSETATKREAVKREKRQNAQSDVANLRKQLEDALEEVKRASPVAKPQLQPSYGLAKPQLSDRHQLAIGDVSEKLNKNNEGNSDPYHGSTTYSRILESKTLEVSEESNRGPPAKAESRSAGGPGDLPEVGSLNGATSAIVADLAGWLNPYSPDLKMAHTQLAEAVRIYGETAVRDGYADLKADHADGKIRALTVKAFYGFVRTAKERAAKRRGIGPKPKLSRW